MAGISIPESSLEALGTLIRASDQAMAELFAAAADVPVSLNRETVRKTISSKIKSVAPDELDKLVHLLLTLNATRGHFDVPIPEFVDEVLEGMAGSRRKELLVTGEEEKKVRERLAKLLSFASLSTAAKAMHLRDDHERVFYFARILTDARPVYGIDPKVRPAAMVVSHTLKLSFSKDDGFGDFYIVLDREDLEFLKDLLERAEEKEESLKQVFQSISIPIVEP